MNKVVKEELTCDTCAVCTLLVLLRSNLGHRSAHTSTPAAGSPWHIEYTPPSLDLRHNTIQHWATQHDTILYDSC